VLAGARVAVALDGRGRFAGLPPNSITSSSAYEAAFGEAAGTGIGFAPEWVPSSSLLFF